MFQSLLKIQQPLIKISYEIQCEFEVPLQAKHLKNITERPKVSDKNNIIFSEYSISYFYQILANAKCDADLEITALAKYI